MRAVSAGTPALALAGLYIGAFLGCNTHVQSRTQTQTRTGDVSGFYLKWADDSPADRANGQITWKRYEISSRDGMMAVRGWLTRNAGAVKASQVGIAASPSFMLYAIGDGHKAEWVPLWEAVPAASPANSNTPWKPNLPASEVDNLKHMFEKHGAATEWDPNPSNMPDYGHMLKDLRP